MAKTVIKRFFTVIIAAVAAAVFNIGSVQAADMMGHPVMENVIDIPEITECSDDGISRYGVSYPKVYDPRTDGKVTSVKNQGSYNNCWAFSSVAAIESNLIKKGIANNTIDLSENHLAYYFYNRKTDSLNYTKNDRNVALRDKWYNNGGTLMGTSVALTTWAGLTKESNSKYISTPGKNICYKHDYVVKSFYTYKYSVNNVKEAISKHGAVAAGMYISEDYYNSKYGAYYCNKDDGNHAVAIVGWNDNYSRNNFKSSIKPKSNGAWIVKNSYGTGFADNGYLYISYEDKSLSEIMAYDAVREKDFYDNNYQHDGSASCVYSTRMNKGYKAANIFTVKASKKYNEVLKAVSVNTFSTNAKYSLQIYTGLTDSSNPESGKAMFSKPQTGVLKNAGYNNIALKKPINLAAGEKFSVVFNFSASSSSVMLGVDSSYSASWIKFNSYSGSKRSFLYYADSWIDYGKNYNGILRIKAYTNNTKTVPKYKISKTKLTIKSGASAKLSIIATPSSMKRNVKWSSSNKKVAQVTGNGTVKGKSAGRAVIKAKFPAGGSAKVLKCNVKVKK